MRPEDVTFRLVDAEIQDVPAGTERRQTEVVEIRKPDGNVMALPATDVNPESGQRYCDLFGDKYAAFKADPGAERSAQLKAEIADREAELKALSDKPKDEPEPDFANMSEDDLRKWIADNGGDEQRSNASHATLVHVAEGLQAKAVRKRARAAARTEAE
jgi:hypothetical protein